MATPRITPTRDAIVTLLNAASLTPKLTAAAGYSTLVGLDQLKGGRIIVVCRDVADELETYDATLNQKITVCVAVQYKGADITTATLDPYQLLAEQVRDLFLATETRILDGNGNAGSCIEVEWPEGAFVPEVLEEMGAFSCPIYFTFNFDG